MAVPANPTLVPNANVLVGGSGANRTVTVTPVTGQSGTSTITLTVNDGAGQCEHKLHAGGKGPTSGNDPDDTSRGTLVAPMAVLTDPLDGQCEVYYARRGIIRVAATYNFSVAGGGRLPDLVPRVGAFSVRIRSL